MKVIFSLDTTKNRKGWNERPISRSFDNCISPVHLRTWTHIELIQRDVVEPESSSELAIHWSPLYEGDRLSSLSSSELPTGD